MPVIRNPGPWSFGIFTVSCLLVAFLYWKGYPDAVKLAGALVGVAIAAFGARSALAKQPTDPISTPPPPLAPPPTRARLDTWDGFDNDKKEGP